MGIASPLGLASILDPVKVAVTGLKNRVEPVVLPDAAQADQLSLTNCNPQM